MTVAFVVDTSASMNQRCANGLTLLDCAKSAVEHFVKMRLRDISWHRTDRYILVTCDDENAIKVVDRFPFTNFMRALKSIEAHDLTQIGSALQQGFDYLHLQRLANDIDKYGQGRNPCSIEPTTILLLTDGTELTHKTGLLKSIVPSGPAPLGGELTTKPYRWDQRVFATVLRIPSVNQQILESCGPLPQNAPISGLQAAVAMDSDISAFCDSTGGKCFVATSWKVLMQHIEVTARLSTCVVVSFENIQMPGSVPLPPQVHAACQRKLLFIKGNQPHQGHWPIPEAYWPDPTQQFPPPRDPHPTIAYKAIDSDPLIPSQFIYDKYDIESNPIAGFMTKAASGACWQIFIRNSKGPNGGYGDPFGYLKLDRLGNALTLFILPYNYPLLFQLLDQAAKMPKITGLAQWRQEMERYCNGIPCYYGPPLRAALRQWGMSLHFVPDSVEKSLYAGFVGNQLKRLKNQAKTDWETMNEKIINASNHRAVRTHERLLPTSKYLVDTEEIPKWHSFPMTQFTVRLSPNPGSPDTVLVQKNVEVRIPCSPSSTQRAAGPSPSTSASGDAARGGNDSHSVLKESAIFKNPFDVSKEELMCQAKYLPIRVALAMDARAGNEKLPVKHSAMGSLAARLVAKEEEAARHCVPIEKMGDFSDALWKQQPPRNPFAEEQERTKQQKLLFGNPYRQEKNEAADEAWLEGGGGSAHRGRKRRLRPAASPSVSTSSTSSGESNNNSTSSSSGNSNVNTTSINNICNNSNSNSNSNSNNNNNNNNNNSSSSTSSGSSSNSSDGNTEVTSPSKNGKSVATDNKLPEEQAANGTVGEAASPSSEGVKPPKSGNVTWEAPPASNELPPKPSKRRKTAASTRVARLRDSRLSDFVLAALRALRHASSTNSTQQLMDLLSSSDVVEDKTHLVEQLIREAHRYKKPGVASKLIDFQKKLTSTTTSS